MAYLLLPIACLAGFVAAPVLFYLMWIYETGWLDDLLPSFARKYKDK